MKNLWILTEERPKKEVLVEIIRKFCLDNSISVRFSGIFIKPLIKNKKFSFTYELRGIVSEEINNVYIKIVSGNGSFVDFLVFFQEKEPIEGEEPLYAIEETKTDDSESRNTGVYQRSSKFVYINFFYPNCRKIMLYNLRVIQKEEPTRTNLFGTRMLLTLGIEILGKRLDQKIFKKFDNLDDLINFKKSMRKAPKGNVPISIIKKANRIEISGRLFKAGSLSHDPNIGALSLIAQTIRKLGWQEEIVITQHGLVQKHLGGGNKFVKIANKMGIKLEGLTLPEGKINKDYWHYEINSEKLGTIFLHLILEEQEGVRGIYENHAGCERGYFYTKNNNPTIIHKYIKNDKKNGKIPKIPDLIVAIDTEKTILNLEGKTYDNKEKGLEDIKLFGIVEEEYIKPSYPDYNIIRGVVLYGGAEKDIKDKGVIFLLNSNGEMIISEETHTIIIKAIKLIINLNKE